MYSVNVHRSRGWTRVKPGTVNLIQVSHVWGRNPGIWTTICCLLGVLAGSGSRSLEYPDFIWNTDIWSNGSICYTVMHTPEKYCQKTYFGECEAVRWLSDAGWWTGTIGIGNLGWSFCMWGWALLLKYLCWIWHHYICFGILWQTRKWNCGILHVSKVTATKMVSIICSISLTSHICVLTDWEVITVLKIDDSLL